MPIVDVWTVKSAMASRLLSHTNLNRRVKLSESINTGCCDEDLIKFFDDHRELISLTNWRLQFDK